MSLMFSKKPLHRLTSTAVAFTDFGRPAFEKTISGTVYSGMRPQLIIAAAVDQMSSVGGTSTDHPTCFCQASTCGVRSKTLSAQGSPSQSTLHATTQPKSHSGTRLSLLSLTAASLTWGNVSHQLCGHRAKSHTCSLGTGPSLTLPTGPSLTPALWAQGQVSHLLSGRRAKSHSPHVPKSHTCTGLSRPRLTGGCCLRAHISHVAMPC